MKKSLVITLALVFVLGIAGTAFAAANPFVDVPAKHWAYDAVNQLYKAGIMEGHAGKFNGDKTLTRYEIAQIVAKAMAKSDKADAATKAVIDKLAVEFAAELNNLGVRVAALEKKADNFKWNADYRVRYIDADKANSDTTIQQRFRLKFAAAINEDMTFNARYMAYDHTEFGTNGTANKVVDSNVVAKNFLGTTATLGRYSQKFGVIGNIMDSTGMVDGAKFAWADKDLAVTLGVANFKSSASTVAIEDAIFAEASYKFNKDLALTVGMLQEKVNDARKDADFQWAGISYKVAPDFVLLADYGKNTKSDKATIGGPADATFQNFRLAYKGANASKPGSWGAHVEYAKVEKGAIMESGSMAGIAADRKLWSVQYSNALAKNVLLDVIYSFNIKKANGDDVNIDKSGEDFTRVQVNFFF